MPDLVDAGGIRGWRGAQPGEVLLELARGVASVAVARDGSVRLRAASGAELPPDPGLAIGREPFSAAPAEPYPCDGGGVALSFQGSLGSVEVEIEVEPFRLTVRDGAGRQLGRLSDLALGEAGAARISLDAPPGAHYFGFGEKAGGLDKRGQVLVMRNRDASIRQNVDPLYVAIPFFLELRREPAENDGAGKSARATGFLLDAFAPSRFDVAAADPARVRIETLAGGLDLTVFPGPLPADVLRRFTERVGRCPLPPLWALGHHQSRWSYGSIRSLRRVARELRRRRIPTDAIHLDIDYMDGYRVFTWHPRRFPEPKRILAELDALGFRAVAIVDPGVKVDEGYDVYREGVGRDAFCRKRDGSAFHLRVWPKTSALPDFNRKDVRDWWGQKHRTLLDAGVAGIWNDMNEPAGWERDVRLGRAILPVRNQDLSDVVQADPGDAKRSVPHEHVRNLYGYQECRATRAFLEREGKGRRPFLLSRAGYAGSGRLSAIWTGDNASRWDHLRLSLPMLMNLSLSGVPFCGADIGGFARRPSRELYARWIQIGALYPFARTHTWWIHPRQEAWRFGKRVEGIARAALELRMRLLPYLYGIFRDAEATGCPVWRPLFYEFPDDASAVDIDDQVMVGAWLLAAPVLEPGARQRRVYLPPGIWYSFYDDARYVGPRSVEVAAPLEQMPLFVRGGAVIPTQSPILHVREQPAEPLILEVFPGGDGGVTLVEDDGETLAYQNGALARTTVRLRHRAAGRLRLELASREGDFDVAPRPMRVRVHGCPAPQRVLFDGTELAPTASTPGWVAAEGRVGIRFQDDGSSHFLEIEPAP